MADIKTRKKEKVTIKTLDRTAIMGSKLKENIVNAKNKTKESYETNENSSQEYAQDKIQNEVEKLNYYGVYKANQIGKKSLKGIPEDLKNTKQNFKKAREGMKKVKRSVKTVKRAGKRTKNTIKIAKRTIKTAEQTTKATIKTTQKVVQASLKATKVTIQTIQKMIKATISIVKAIIATVQALISAIIAGGWVAVVIIIVICLIAMICNSIFGIFFSNEKDIGDKTMSSVIQEINMEFTNKITEIQNNNSHDEYEISSNRAEWKDILSVYAVIISNGEEETNVITLDENKIKRLKSIFWEMNIITSRIDEIEKEIEITDDKGNTKIEKVKRKVLYIDITSKTVEEMIYQYQFSQKQIVQLAELRKDEYNSLWVNVIYGSSVGSNDIVQVALAQVGNVGGQPYWSWYGFNGRVEWCACFVSWCANKCGYIENGIIPKFANCQNEGVAWFKTCGLWKNGGYTPNSRRYYIF